MITSSSRLGLAGRKSLEMAGDSARGPPPRYPREPRGGETSTGSARLAPSRVTLSDPTKSHQNSHEIPEFPARAREFPVEPVIRPVPARSRPRGGLRPPPVELKGSGAVGIP